jgi:hypothetical protein
MFSDFRNVHDQLPISRHNIVSCFSVYHIYGLPQIALLSLNRERFHGRGPMRDHHRPSEWNRQRHV